MDKEHEIKLENARLKRVQRTQDAISVYSKLAVKDTILFDSFKVRNFIEIDDLVLPGYTDVYTRCLPKKDLEEIHSMLAEYAKKKLKSYTFYLDALK